MNKKKFTLFGLLAMFFVLPFAFLLTACGGDGDKNKINNVYISLDGEPESQTAYISDYYNPNFTLRSLYGRVSFVFEYKDGSRKKADEENYTEEELAKFSYSESYYVGRGYDEQTGQFLGWDLLPEDQVDSSAAFNVGNYKIVFTIEGYDTSLEISVMKASTYEKSVNIAVVGNDVTNYSAYYYNSSYKFGMPEAKIMYDEDTYTSDVKAYVYDVEARENISGTKATGVYAIPQVAPEDYRFVWTDYIGGEMQVTAGDNLVDKYNEIACDDENILGMRREQFLYNYASRITTGKVRDDNTLVVNTEFLEPGNYYTIAMYEDSNHSANFTTPKKSSVLRVLKGDFDFKKTIHLEYEDYDEKVATNFINSLSFSLSYTFDTSNPLFTTSTSKALSIDLFKDMEIQVESTYPNWQDDIECSAPGIGGRGVFGWTTFELTGKDENGHTVTRLDASDDGIKLQAKIRMDDELKKYYGKEDETIYLVTVSINKGYAYKPILEGYNSFEYDGTAKTLPIRLDTPQVFAVTGSNIAQTNIGTYHTTYTLKDTVNYEVWDDQTYTSETFDWEIRKIIFDEFAFTEKTCIYNNTEQSTYEEITYVPGAVNSMRVRLSGSTQYDLIKTLVPTASINWSLDNTEYFINAAITPDGDDVIFTFDGMTGNSAYVNLNYSIDATNYSDAFNPVNPVQLFINKRPYTTEELAAIYGDFFEETEYYGMRVVNPIQIRKLTKVISASADPASDASVTTTLGSWSLYYYYNENYVLAEPGTTVLPDWIDHFKYVFTPANPMYASLDDVYVGPDKVNYYTEDMPASVIAALATEISGVTTVTLENYSTEGLSVPQYALPDHDNTNTDFEDENGNIIDGQWVLLWDYEDEQGNPAEMTAGNNQILRFEVNEQMQYSVRSKDYMASSERNWRVAFIPTNSAYNRYVVAATVIIPD